MQTSYTYCSTVHVPHSKTFQQINLLENVYIVFSFLLFGKEKIGADTAVKKRDTSWRKRYSKTLAEEEENNGFSAEF